MPASPGRNAAYRVLLRVALGRGFAVDLLQLEAISRLKEADRRLATEIVMGVLRWRGELDFQIEQISGKRVDGLDPEVATLLRMGVYQIRFLERIPKPAVVNEAVELAKMAGKRSAAGLINAVLRKCGPPPRRPGASPFENLDEEERGALQRALPAWLFDRWAAREWLPASASGRETALRLGWESTQVPPATLHVANATAQRVADLAARLDRQGVVAAPCVFGRSALTVKSGRVLTTRVFRDGEITIQDEASQLVAELVSPAPGQRALDLCAAPGMKGALLAELMGCGDLVVSDLSARRLATLKRLLPAKVPPGVRLRVVRLDGTRSLPFGVSFDRILLDAPCSGTGTLARNPEIKWRLSPRDLARFAEAQKALLGNALAMLAPAGRLVYSTCSLEPEENEQVVEAILGERPEFRMLPDLARHFPTLLPLFDAQGYFRTRPDLHHMDGFFAAVLGRNS